MDIKNNIEYKRSSFEYFQQFLLIILMEGAYLYCLYSFFEVSLMIFYTLGIALAVYVMASLQNDPETSNHDLLGFFVAFIGGFVFIPVAVVLAIPFISELILRTKTESSYLISSFPIK